MDDLDYLDFDHFSNSQNEDYLDSLTDERGDRVGRAYNTWVCEQTYNTHGFSHEDCVCLDHKIYCPNCTQLIYSPTDYYRSHKYSKNPIFLVKRINKKTNDWFWGCPNFPKCKFSQNRPETSEERNRRTWAWANATGGPHY